LTEISGVKTWEDNDNQDGVRPEKIEIRLYADNDYLKSIFVEGSATKNEGWTYTFDELDKYRDHGTEIKYSVDEVLPDGYTKTITGYDITNKHNPEKTSVSVKKAWEDDDNRDNLRPVSIKVRLMVDANADIVAPDAEAGEAAETRSAKNVAPVADAVVTLDESNDWSYTWSELDKYKSQGTLIRYTVEEVDPDENYLEPRITMLEADGGMDYIITNTHNIIETQASVKKIWDDGNNRDGKRPEVLLVNLLADGKVIDTVTLNEANEWAATVEELPMYDKGKEIDYTWEEDTKGLPEGYSLVSADKEGTITTITNHYDIEKTSASVKKVWDDDKDRDGMRPKKLVVTLMRGGSNNAAGTGSTDEPKTAEPEKIKDVELNEGNSWSDTVAELDKRDENGNEYRYYWVENDIPKGYELIGNSTDGTITTLTNHHDITMIRSTVDKVWNADQGLQVEVLFELFRGVNGGEKEKVASKTEMLTSDSGWHGEFTKLPKYDENHNEYEYSVVETPVAVYKDGQRTEIRFRSDVDPRELSEEEKGFGITNTQIVDIPVKKVWVGQVPQTGIEVQLMKKAPGDAGFTAATDEHGNSKITLSSANGWAYKYTGLDKYANTDDAKAGKAIEYKVEELSEIKGYTTTYSGDVATGFVITNTQDKQVGSAKLTKVDSSNGNALKGATFSLYKEDGTKIGTYTTPDGGTISVDNLEFGNYYFIEDSAPNGYEKTQEKYTFTISETSGVMAPIEIRALNDPVKITASGFKVWDDGNDADRIRPASIRVLLYADGVEVAGSMITVTADASGTWAYDFGKLPKYNSKGKQINYTIAEEMVEGYKGETVRAVDVDGNVRFVITNTHSPEVPPTTPPETPPTTPPETPPTTPETPTETPVIPPANGVPPTPGQVLGVTRTPTPTVNPAVLGARRMVLGARRVPKVLGARRASTGDEATMVMWGTMSLGSLAGFWAWVLNWFKRKKKKFKDLLK
jgi:hypothetical protein